MRKFRLLILMSLALPCCNRLQAQGAGEWRLRHIDADSVILKFDTLSVSPQSLYIQDVNRNQYRLDPLAATLYILDSSLLGKRLFLQYQTYAIDFSRPVAHKSSRMIEPVPARHQLGDQHVMSIQNILKDNELYTNGAISRGVTVGNNQDLVLNSSLNLQISGKLSEDVELAASVSDKNVPIQPEGNTQLLQDISNIFISLKIKNIATVTAGDIAWASPDDPFLRVSRNMLGLSAKASSLPAKGVKMLNQAGGGIAKGKFARQTLSVRNGVQGPYKLFGAEGEVSIIMVAGSERVYVDGQQVMRGADYDYTIDYNTAEITFTPKMLLTAEKRVIVEFEYTNRYYSRYNLFTNNVLEIDGKHPLKLYLNFFHEQDLKNQSIQPELTHDNMRFLANFGDGGEVAYYPFTDTVSYSPERILYEKVDTVHLNNIYTIFIHSNNPDAVLYSPDFTYIGVQRGNYKLSSSTENGRVFAWVAPVDGVPQGDYEPVLQLVPPTSQQMATLGFDLSVRDNTRLQSEFAMTHLDRNTFSKKDRSDDIGFAYLLNISDLERFASLRDSLSWTLGSHAQLQFIHKYFAPFESFREVEFARNYNLATDYSVGRSEWVLRAGIALQKADLHRIDYNLNYLSRVGEAVALRNELTTDDHWRNWRLQSRSSFLLKRDSIQKSRYLVSRFQLSKMMKHFTVRVGNLLEYNLFRDVFNESVRRNSYAFNETTASLQSPEKARHQFLFGYKNRVELTPDTLRLRLHLVIHEANVQYSFAQVNNQSLTMNAVYRNQSLADSSTGKPEHYFVGNLQYTGRFFRNALVVNTYYETGSAMELKKTYTFVKVAAGHGTHVWNDYNGNGIEELDEFEVAAFPDEALYVKVWIPGTDYVNVYQSQWNQSFQLRPAAVWAGKKGFLKFLSRFSNVLTLNASLKHKTRMFIPFAKRGEDTGLVSDRLNLSNTLSFNNSGSPFAFDLVLQKNTNTQFLYYGLETNDVGLQELQLKSTPVTLLYLQTTLAHRVTDNVSTCFDSRNYKVEAYSLGQEVRLQFRNRITAALKGMYVRKVNLNATEHLRKCQAELSFTYRMLNRGTASISAEYIYMNGDAGQNSTVSYFMLEGVGMGQNLLWTVTGQIAVTSFLQLAFQYQGRAIQHHPVIHTGSVTVNAIF